VSLGNFRWGFQMEGEERSGAEKKQDIRPAAYSLPEKKQYTNPSEVDDLNKGLSRRRKSGRELGGGRTHFGRLRRAKRKKRKREKN